MDIFFGYAELLVPLIGILLGLITGFLTVLKAFQARRAESKLRESINKLQDKDFDKQKIRKVISEIAKEPPDEKSLEEGENLLKEAIWSLEPEDREQIIRRLNQPSQRGRADYMIKLLIQIVESKSLSFVD